MSYRNDEGLNGPSPWPGFRDATPRGSDTGLGGEVWEQLGFPSAEAYRQYVSGGAVPAQTYTPPPVHGHIDTTVSYAHLATLRNLTRPGASYLVGDDWLLSVKGAPGQTVTVTARQNSGPWSTSSYGQTSAAGTFELRGRMGAEHVGRWEETWSVGGKAVGSIVFDVKFQPAQTQPGKTPLPPPATDTGVKITPSQPVATDWMATLKAPSLFGLPLWMLIVGVGAGIYFLKRGG